MNTCILKVTFGWLGFHWGDSHGAHFRMRFHRKQAQSLWLYLENYSVTGRDAWIVINGVIRHRLEKLNEGYLARFPH